MGSLFSEQLWRPSVSIVELALRAIIIYAFVVVALRLSGKRTLAQVTTTDLVIVLLVASAIKTPLTYDDKSLSAGFVTMTTLLVVHAIMARLECRYLTFKKMVAGDHVELVRDGRYLEENMAQECVREEDIQSAMRQHGVDKLRVVKLATLEVSGAISIVPIAGQEQGEHEIAREGASTMMTSH